MNVRPVRRLLVPATVGLGLLVTVGPATATEPTPTAEVSAAGQSTLLERAVTVQREFVAAAVAYEKATSAAAQARAVATRAQASADAAAAAGAKARTQMGQYAADLYMRGISGDGSNSALDLVALASSLDPEEALHTQAAVNYLNEQRGYTVENLLKVRDEAVASAKRAQRASASAAASERRASGLLDAIQAKADTLAIEMDEAMAASGGSGIISLEQAALNKGAKDSWAAYLASLARAGVVAPKAAALADPTRLPSGMTALVGANGRAIPGVASVAAAGGPVKVVSAQAIAAVSGALAQIGRPYVPDQVGPEAFDCGGLASSVWGAAGFAFSPVVSTQWATGARVPADQAQPGDLVFLADPRAGLHHVGVLVAPSLMVAASSQTYMVSAQIVPATVFGVVRPTLPPGAVNAVPRSTGKAMRCGSDDDLPALEQSVPDEPLTSGAVTAAGTPLPTRAGRAWGGYSNGMIPAGALCPIGGGQDRMRCDAANAFNAMSVAYQAHFGAPICINDGYRSYPDQIRVFRERPHLAAVPGTSNHGWGLAVDLDCGINRFGTAQHGWMKANAAKFGFFHPQWARQGGPKPEAWHWEFGRIS